MPSIQCIGSFILWQLALAAWDAAQLEVGPLDLLQRHLEIETPEMRRLKASPMFWLHIPKCGTSFYNTLVHLPGNCPGWPVNLSVGDEFFRKNDPKCFEVEARRKCPEWCDQRLLHCDGPLLTDTHELLGLEKYQTYKGKIVAIFRQPEQRFLSSWYDDVDLFRADPSTWVCGTNITPGWLMDMDQFKARWGGSATQQLVGKFNATQADVPMALERLREGLAFVGLQEEWSLSICLFHAKFGGPCRKLEFLDTRPGKNVASTYDTTILNGWVDEMDRPVYAEAINMFKADLEKFGVSHESCTACYEEAGLDLTS